MASELPAVLYPACSYLGTGQLLPPEVWLLATASDLL